jgi:hypothetical protein
MLKGTDKKAVALDNCTALEIIDSTFRIITSKENRYAYKAYWKNDKYYLEKIEVKESFKELSLLTS